MLFRFGGSGGKATACIFCGSPNLTREHVFPRWTREYFKHVPPLRAEASFGRVYPDKTESKAFLLPGPVRHWEVKNVCGGTDKHCNSGWMKSIEDRTKPILLPMIMGQSKPRLSTDELQTIATWAVLKAMVVDRAEGSSWAVHYKQLSYMYRHRRPPKRSWAVWIGRFQRNIWQGEWISRPFRLLPRSTGDAKLGLPTSRYNGNSVTQVIGEVIVHVVHSTDQFLIKDWRFAAPQKVTLSAPFLRIWPSPGHSVLWPTHMLSDGDADHISTALSLSLNRRQRNE